MKLKICSRCGKKKKHGRDKSRRSGIASWCLSCTSDYHQQPKYRWAKAWGNMIRRVENRIGNRPTYKNIKLKISKEEFKEWYIEAMESWEKSNPNQCGSIDRIDNLGDYSLDNLQILELGKNSQKRQMNKNYFATKYVLWCSRCGSYRAKRLFHRNRSSATGRDWLCKQHKRESNNKFRLLRRSKHEASRESC